MIYESIIEQASETREGSIKKATLDDDSEGIGVTNTRKNFQLARALSKQIRHVQRKGLVEEVSPPNHIRPDQ
jgi:hypothetical protein